MELAVSKAAASVRPLVSIIVPSYNQGHFIRRTIESVLMQDYRPIQLIVIDGASTDDTVDVLKSFGNQPELEWVSEPDRGVVDAVNKGFGRANGIFAAIQSSDDFYLPGAVAAAVSALEAEPELAFVYGDISKVDAQGRELGRSNLGEYSLEGMLSFATWIPQPSTFFRLELALALGGWRTDFPYAADTDLWLRMALSHPARKLNRLMAQRSMHEAQRDTQGERIIRDYTACIADLSPKLPNARARAAAAAGTLLLTNRYRTDDGDWARWLRLLQATFAYPHLYARTPLSAYVPGWRQMRTAGSAIKRHLSGGRR